MLECRKGNLPRNKRCGSFQWNGRTKECRLYQNEAQFKKVTDEDRFRDFITGNNDCSSCKRVGHTLFCIVIVQILKNLKKNGFPIFKDYSAFKNRIVEYWHFTT